MERQMERQSKSTPGPIKHGYGYWPGNGLSGAWVVFEATKSGTIGPNEILRTYGTREEAEDMANYLDEEAKAKGE